MRPRARKDRPSTPVLYRALVAWALVVVVAVALTPSPACAWTDATVRSARATVELEEGVRVRVSMTIELRVDGGWLEAFELDGLDAGLALDAGHPPSFVRHLAPSGDETLDAEATSLAVERLEPRVSSHERGRVGFTFSRRHAPRRGDYRVELVYVAPLASAPVAHEDGSLLGWTFPAWRFGLDGVQIDLVLPAGSIVDPAFRAAAEGDAGIVIETSEDELGRSHIHLVRHHLPRTRSWPLTFVVPESVAPAPRGERAAPPVPTALAAAEGEAEPRPWGTLAGAALLLLIVLAKNAALAREDREAARAPQRLRAFLRTLAAVGAFGASAILVLVAPSWLPVAIALLAIAGAHARRAPSEPAPPGAFRAASSAWVRAARAAHRRATRGLSAWLRVDSVRGVALLTALGVLLAAAGAAVPATLPAHHATVLLAGALLTLASGGRSMRERSALVTLGALLELARRVRLPVDEHVGLALAPVVYADAGGRVCAARLRAVLAAPPPGLLRFDVVFTDDDAPRLVAAARRDSVAAERLAVLVPLAEASRERVGCVLPTGPDVGAALWTMARVLSTAPSTTGVEAGAPSGDPQSAGPRLAAVPSAAAA